MIVLPAPGSSRSKKRNGSRGSMALYTAVICLGNGSTFVVRVATCAGAPPPSPPEVEAELAEAPPQPISESTVTQSVAMRGKGEERESKELLDLMDD